MAFQVKVVLYVTSEVARGLEALVEAFLADGVKFVGVVGNEASRVEDIIDEIVVADGSDDSRFILTASHPGESLQDAVDFAHSLTGEFSGEVQVVEI